MTYFMKWYAPCVSPAFERIPEEQERFEAMRDALTQSYLDAWEVSGKGPHALNISRKEAGPYSPREMRHLKPLPWMGFDWPSFDEPLRDLVKKVPKSIKDIVNTSFGYAVSEKFIEILEAHDAGRNRYFPFEFVDREGKPLPERRWLLNITSRLDTIDVERSGPNIVDPKGDTVWVNSGPTSLVFDKQRIAGRAIWYEWRYVHAGIAVTDAFWTAMQKAKCTGWAPTWKEHFPEV